MLGSVSSSVVMDHLNELVRQCDKCHDRGEHKLRVHNV